MRDERGTGMVSSIVGVTAFLSLLLFATQLVLNLYATSTCTGRIETPTTSQVLMSWR